MFVGSRVFFITFDPEAKIGTQQFPPMELEAASEAEGVHGGGMLPLRGPREYLRLMLLLGTLRQLRQLPSP